MLYVVVMAGGSGTRFWPKSRKNIPKQCIPITSDKPMIVETVDRLLPIVQRPHVYIVTGKHLEKPIKDLLPDVNYVVEPMAKNTAAAIALSALFIAKEDPDATLFIETTDHAYSNVDLYLSYVKKAVEWADKGHWVQVGITPLYPETGFGYIESGEELDECVYRIASFKEKPDISTAKVYLEKGSYLWNSGMFVFKVSALFNAFKRFMPGLYNGLMKIKDSDYDEETIKEVFEGLDSVPIDVGVSEKIDNAVMIKADMPWDDVGDWKAMERIHPKDERGNVIIAEHSGTAKNCIIIGNSMLIETGDVEDLVIVDTVDCLFVCDKERCQEVKKIVEMLKQDSSLVRYSEDIQEKYNFHKVSIDCENIEIKSTGLVATIGVDGLSIIKDSKVTVRYRDG